MITTGRRKFASLLRRLPAVPNPSVSFEGSGPVPALHFEHATQLLLAFSMHWCFPWVHEGLGVTCGAACGGAGTLSRRWRTEPRLQPH